MSSEALTFLFTDIEGSTQLLGRVGGTTYASILSDHHALIRAQLTGFGGEEIDTAGDGFFAVFSSARRCAAAVIAMQRALQGNAWPGGESVRVRMGVHSGEAIREATGVVGMDVHRAARVAGVAHGGQILLSETTAGLIRDELPRGAMITDLGTHRLKDLGAPRSIFQLSAPDLLDSFPRLRSLDNPQIAHNLPAQSASFVGREQELIDVQELLGASRLVTVTGSGGAGKTRLALQSAAELLDGSADGAWLVELAAVSDPADVATRTLDTLGVSAQAGVRPLESLVTALSLQRLLLILDNCEHLLDACAELAGTVLNRCSKVHILVTSREPLGISGESIYRIPSLSLPPPGSDDDRGGEEAAAASSDAVTLFRERALLQGVALELDPATAELIASICRRLDGMPLAIELAVARLRGMSLPDLFQRLDQRFRLLTGGSRNALPRQRTLEATVQWSYALLDEREATLLRRLSVFVDGFDLSAAETVCASEEIDAFDVMDVLGSLVDKSLVATLPQDGGIRYRLLETVRQFAADRLLDVAPDEIPRLADAHGAHFLSFAQAMAPELLRTPVQTTARLDIERANLHSAFDWAADGRQELETLLGFTLALSQYWHDTGPPADCEARLLRAVTSPAPDPLAAWYIRGLAEVAQIVETPTLILASRAVELARAFGDPAVVSLTLATMIKVRLRFTGLDLDDGLRDEALGLARASGDEEVLLDVLFAAYSAMLQGSTDSPAQIDAIGEEALSLAQRLDNHLTADILLTQAGLAAMGRGQLAEARRCLEASDLRSGTYEITSSLNLGMLDALEGELRTAQERFTRAFALARRQGDLARLGYASAGLAMVAARRENWPRAVTLQGLADGFMTAAGRSWRAFYAALWEPTIAGARSGLGNAEYERLGDAARSHGVDAAVEQVLALLALESA